jgi:hypothetical protein
MERFTQWTMPSSFDNGISPSVAINDNGLMCEVHGGPGHSYVWLRCAEYDLTKFTSTGAAWNLTLPLADWTPVYAVNEAGCDAVAVDASTAGVVILWNDNGEDIWFMAGPAQANLNAQGSSPIAFGNTGQMDIGYRPDVAINNAGQVCSVHVGSADETIFYNVGQYGNSYVSWYGAGNPVSPNGSGTIAGDNPRIAINNPAGGGPSQLLVTWESVPGQYSGDPYPQLFLLPGTINSDATVTWGSVSTVGQGWNADVALDPSGGYVLTYLNSWGSYWTTGICSGNAVVSMDSSYRLSPDYGNSSITVASNSNGQLIAETGSNDVVPNGFVSWLGQTTTGDYSSWMSDMLQVDPAFGTIPICMLALPGTHDSATYGISATAELSPDAQSAWWSFGTVIVANWARAQALDLGEQLSSGVRYFDLRVCWTETGEIMTCHSLFGPSLSEALAPLVAFYANGQHAEEIAILDMNHLLTTDGGTPNTNVMSSAEVSTLVSQVITQLGNLLIPFEVSGVSVAGMSLNEIYATDAYANGGRVLVIANDPSVSSSGFGVDTSDTYNPWPNQDHYQGLISTYLNSDSTYLGYFNDNWSKYLSSLAPTPESAYQMVFGVFQALGTPDAGVISATAGLPDFDMITGSPALFWAAQQNEVTGVNIIIADQIQQTTLPALCSAINLKKIAAVKAASPG